MASAHLVRMRDERGTGEAADQLLRYRDGQPITHRRYDHLWNRIGKHLPWVAIQGISTHWLRHTTPLAPPATVQDPHRT